MFKKFNWGHGIALFYTIFAIALLTALVKSRGIDHSLVVEDYYAKDIAYQSTYNKKQNSLTKDIKVNFDKQNKLIKIDFEEEKAISGTIHFYRPSDISKDFTKNIDQGMFEVSTNEMLPGKWVVKMDWTAEGVSFYKEKTIYI